MPLLLLLDCFAVKACIWSCRKSDQGRQRREAARTNGIILHHTQRSVLPRSREGLVVACHGHGDEPDGYDAAFCWRRVGWLADVSGGWEAGKNEGEWGKGGEIDTSFRHLGAL